MIITEKKYWRNGFDIHGQNFKSFALSLFCWGLIVSWGSVMEKKVKTSIHFYKLT
jgi:hypothetical protein